MDANNPPSEADLLPEKIEDKKEEGRSFHCDLYDKELVHKIAQEFLPGLATACVDNTIGDIFKTAGTVAVDVRTEMVHYLTQRSESFVAETVILEDPKTEVSDHPFDIISDFIDDFALSKRNLFGRVSGWLLSERREDRIDDFQQEMEISGFWPIERRAAIAQTLLKNVDFKNTFHCNMKFDSVEELAEHVLHCGFKSMHCPNEGCNAIFSASQMEKHDSVCPFKIIPCEQKCSESLMRRFMDRHCITVCPMKLVNCSFYPVGCHSTIPQCMMQEHREDDLHSHLLYVLQVIHKEIQVEDLEKRAEQLKELFFDKLVKAADVRSLTFAIKDSEVMLGPIQVIAKNKVSEERKVDEEDEVNGGKLNEGGKVNEDGKINAKGEVNEEGKANEEGKVVEVNEEGKTNGGGGVKEAGGVDQGKAIEGKVNEEGKVNVKEKVLDGKVNAEGEVNEGDKVSEEGKGNKGDKVNEKDKANEADKVNEKGKVKEEGKASEGDKINEKGKANECDNVNEKGMIKEEGNVNKESKANEGDTEKGKVKEEGNVKKESKANGEGKANEGDRVKEEGNVKKESKANESGKANKGDKVKEEGNVSKESKANEGGAVYEERKVNEGKVSEKGREILNSEAHAEREDKTQVWT